MSNQEILSKFYSSFQQGDVETMCALYHPDATFSDPVFRNLNSEEVKAMWRMLLERANGQLTIEFHSVLEAEDTTSAIWEARYPFSQTGRKVHNIIKAKMVFRDGKIILHQDTFNLWKWAGMALGIPGYLLGWSPIIRNKIRKNARKALIKYMENLSG
jgi:ketosteroid isomerase-like protein